MAIDVHTHIFAQKPSDSKKKTILVEFQGSGCTPMTMIGMAILLKANKKKITIFVVALRQQLFCWLKHLVIGMQSLQQKLVYLKVLSEGS